MLLSWLVFWGRIKDFTGKTNRIYSYGRFSLFLVLLLFLCSAFSGSCDDFPMVSVPLGFEINGIDKNKNWVSENGGFAFGFLDKNGDDIDSYVVGVRYNLGNITENVPVWTVGGGVKVPMNSTVRLDMDGRLVLIDNSHGNVVWSSNSSTMGVEKATLLNNGNLVLLDNKDKAIWESFNSPTNVLLPGQSLCYPQNLRAPSTKSTLSYYSLLIRQSGELALVWEHNVTYWKSQFSSSQIVKEARFDTDGVLGLFDADNKVVWSVSSRDFGDPSVSLRHLRIDQDGNLRIYSWDNLSHTWKSGWQAVKEECNVFGACGLYSVCGYNSSSPVCKCLYSPDSEWELAASAVTSNGLGCPKTVDLGNCRAHSIMFGMRQTVVYGLYPPNDVNMFMSEKDCKDYCLNDTNCFAITSMNDGSGLCTVKRTSFISGYRTPSVPANSYLKLCSLPQAVAAQSANPHDNAEIISSSVGRHRDAGGKGRMFIGTIALIVLVTVSTVVIMEMFVFWLIYRRRKLKAQTRIPFGKDAQMDAHYSVVIRLNFEEIKELTDNFANPLGPSLFKGALPNKTAVVAKVLKNVNVPDKEFRVAVAMLSGTHHRNVVSVKGFCFEPKHKYLVYEYLPNGSLDQWLLNKKKQDTDERPWQQRLHIAVEIGRAIAYLHTECQQCIVHGNLKLENVLFDENFVPKVTEFGLQSFVMKETTCSSSSESLSERDIYMLGELLLQIVICKRDVSVKNLQQVLDELHQEQKFLDSDDLKAAERVSRIAIWCMQTQPYLRPSINEVVKVLEGTLSVDRPPSGFLLRQDNLSNGETATEIEVEES